jgi:putative addiction module component (TIGR02574 family)
MKLLHGLSRASRLTAGVNDCILPAVAESTWMSTLESVLADAAQLPVADRLELINAIWDTLPDEALPPLSDEWMTEIGRRSAELAAGTANSVAWDVVRSEARARLRTAPIRDQAE